ncbi:MAG: lysophospholipid acyltransferase family protein [Bdellovibrionales bacterium]|nr:lysophospholipid acyltransferase family protein [Bdellovibrionales bacterium]
MSKQLNSIAEFTVGWLGSLMLASIKSTLRWTNIKNAEDNCFWEFSEPGICAFWHDQQLMMPWLFLDFKGDSNRNIYMLISQHRDGRLVASAVERLGIKTIAGSSTRGGKEAIFRLAAKIRKENFVAITPDGPRGPRHKVKDGVIRLAQLTGAPIYPVAIEVKRAWEFSSWDRMRLAKPFTKATRVIGDPIYVPRQIPKSNNYATDLEKALIEISNLAKLKAQE